MRVRGPGLAPIIIAKVSPPSKQTPPPPSTSSAGAGQEAGGGRLADAPNAGEHEGMGDPARSEGIGQGPDHGLLADQVRAVFADDVATVGSGGGDLVAVIDALTSLESWDVMRRTHSRSDRQIERAWRQGIDAVIAAWPPAHDDNGGDR